MKGADDLDARVLDVLGEVCRRPFEAPGPDDDLVERLGLDSLEGLHILAAMEKRFAVRFPDERLEALRTVRAIADAIRGLREGGAR